MNLIKVTVTFTRTERRNVDPRVSCTYDSIMTVFAFGDKYSKEDVHELAVGLASDQVERWWSAAVEINSISEPVEIGLSIRRYLELRNFLDSYNDVGRDSLSWKEEWEPKQNLKVSDYMIAHLVYCGLSGRAIDTMMSDVMLDLLDAQDPCADIASCREDIEEKLKVDSWSIYMFKGKDIIPRARLDKNGGWTRQNVAKRPNLTSETQKFVSRKVRKFVNPLEGKTFEGMLHEDTLKFMKRNALNPIPIYWRGKHPMVRWMYLNEEPITDEHFSLFEGNANIGVVAGFNNIVLIDNDTNIDLGFDTTAIRGKRGINYIFITDEPFGKVYKLNEEVINGRNAWDEIAVKRSGYIVLPDSVHPSGIKYEWANKRDPAYITAEDLRMRIEEKINEVR